MPQALVFVFEWIGAALAMEMTLTAVALFNIASAVLLVGGLAYSASKARQAKRNAKDAYNSAQVDRLINVSSSVASRELVLGRVRKGGAVIYKASTGEYQKDFYLVVALAGHEIDAIEDIWLNDVKVTLDGDGDVATEPYAVAGTVTATQQTGAGTTVTLPATYVVGSVSATVMQWVEYARSSSTTSVYEEVSIAVSVVGLTATTSSAYATVTYQVTDVVSNVRITKYLGAPGQAADPSLMAAFPSDWTANDTMQGVAYIVAKFTYSESSFPSGLPNITATIRGAKMYDPRNGTTVWSENPALMMRHIYSHPKFGKATVSAAEDARFVVAANACDTIVNYPGTTFAFYSFWISLSWTINTPLFRASLVLPFGALYSGLDDLAQAMGGSWAHAGGEIYIKAGTYTAPVVTLTDADLAVVQRTGTKENQQPIGISVHRERAAKFNTVKARIWDMAQDYKQVLLTPLASSALITADGAELVQEVTYPAIGWAPQAQHVAGIMMRDARDPLVVELPVKLTMYRVELFETVAVTLSRYGWVDKTFMLIAREWNADGSLKFTLKETTAAITQMDAGFNPQGFAANTNLPSPWIVQKIGALTVSSGTNELVLQSDGTVTSRMRVSWPQSTDISVVQAGQIEVQYRLASSTNAWASLVVPGNETQVVTAEVTDRAIYAIRARAKTTLAVSDWNTQVVHQVVGKTEPPPPFDTFIVMAQPDGTRQFNFGYTTTAKPADWQGAQIRYVSGNVASPVWADMTPLQDGTSFYTASPVEANAPMSGEYTFACRSIDTSGNMSTALLDTITLSSRRTGNVFDEFDEYLAGWAGTRSGFNIVGGYLEAADSTLWSGLSTWTAWTRWNTAPTSPCTYTTPSHDLGTVISGQIDALIDADGTTVLELATSADGSTWSAWGNSSVSFTTKWIKLRLTVTATGPMPVPVVRSFYWTVSADMKREYINDVVISGLTGNYRIGTGDIRVPLANTYTVIKRIGVTIQDSSAGTWTWQRIDNVLTYGPRLQFKLSGTLADPSYVDFDIEGI